MILKTANRYNRLETKKTNKTVTNEAVEETHNA